MSIRVTLAGVREYEYVHAAGKGQPAQIHLRAAKRELERLVPGMRVLVSGSGQSLPVVPWIAILDPDVTTTAQEGLYVVYLYSRDLSRVYLSMNQGTTQHKRNAERRDLSGKRAESEALAELELESSTLRAQLSAAALDGLLTEIDLAAPGYFLPRSYEVGNVAAISYNVAQLPGEATLRADLTRMIGLYATCVEVKNQILATEPEKLHTTAGATKARPASPPRPPIFRPKSSAAYRAEVKAHSQERSRRHEGLIAVFGEWIKLCGIVPATNVHPRDLTADAEGQHWLIEAKTVRANAESAVREAIGQLICYRHFYYREQGQPDPALVALFSESVGDAFPQLLESIGIESIWRDGETWDGRAPVITTSLLKIAQAGQPSGALRREQSNTTESDLRP